jgi:hypothetical protein
MTNPLSPRFTGFIRDVRTSKRYLQQTLSQVFFSSFLFSHQYFHHSRQQLQQQVQLKKYHIRQGLVHHQHLLLIQFIIKQYKARMNC